MLGVTQLPTVYVAQDRIGQKSTARPMVLASRSCMRLITLLRPLTIMRSDIVPGNHPGRYTPYS